MTFEEIRAYHDRGQQRGHRSRLYRVTDCLLTAVLCVFGPIRIGAHSVTGAIRPVSTQMVRSYDNATPLTGAGL